MATDTLQKKSIEELNAELQAKRIELRDFRFSIAGAGARNGKKGKNLRQDIARILTEINTR